MKFLHELGAIALTLVLSASGAQASEAFVSRDVNMRAGPSTDYLVITTLPADQQIDILGSLQDYTWCDVQTGPDRGWVYAANIRYIYHGQPVSVLGAGIGIGVVGFALDDYWRHHYSHRSWYGDRSRWAHHGYERYSHDRHGHDR
jgi:uncharacterized protein YraI